MKKVLGLFFALAVFPVAAEANSLYDQVNENVAAATAVKHPQSVLFGFRCPLLLSEYRDFQFAQVEQLLGKQTAISFAVLLNKPYFKMAFAALSAEQRARLKEIAAMEAPTTMVSEPELLTMLVLLDANWEVNPANNKETFKMDTNPSLGQTGGITQASTETVANLLAYMNQHTRAKEKEEARKLAVRKAQREQEDAKAYAAKEQQVTAQLKQLKMFDENGDLNGSEAAKAMELLTAFGNPGADEFLQRAAKVAFGKRLKSIRWRQTRSNDLDAVLTDDTKLNTDCMGVTFLTITFSDGTQKYFKSDGTPSATNGSRFKI